jgi:hypothetical protein
MEPIRPGDIAEMLPLEIFSVKADVVLLKAVITTT